MKIHAIQIETAALDRVVEFYHHRLEFPCVGTPGKAYFQAGDSQLVFSENAGFAGLYHFAFNIPSNQIREAMAWLERRDVDAVLRHGVSAATDALLQKPFTPISLTRKVRDVLDGLLAEATAELDDPQRWGTTFLLVQAWGRIP